MLAALLALCLAGTPTPGAETPPEAALFIRRPDQVRIHRGDAFVDAVVCFGCGQILFFDAQGQRFRGGSFDFRILKRMARDAFPQEFGEKKP